MKTDYKKKAGIGEISIKKLQANSVTNGITNSFMRKTLGKQFQFYGECEIIYT